MCVHRLNVFLTIALFMPLTAAAQQDGSENSVQRQATVELLALHRGERRAHLDHDVEALLVHLGPELLDVRDGRVNRMSKNDVRVRFVEYFKHSQFWAWDDVEAPIVHVSPDGKMGWMIVQVRIAYTETDVSGKKTNQDSVAAWMSTYEKQNGNWIMTAVTSTFAEK